jgi:hypothetical protein
LKLAACGAFTVSLVAVREDGGTAVAPKRTCCTEPRPVPVIVTVVPPETPPVRGATTTGAPFDACTGAGALVPAATDSGAAAADGGSSAHPVRAATLSAAAVATYARASMRREGVGSTAAG